MLRTLNAVVAATASLGALLAAGCTTTSTPLPHGGPGPHGGALEQMRAHHRCVEGEMAIRADGGRAMPGKDQMAAMMERCPMPAAMRDSMMMRGGMQAGKDAANIEHPEPNAPTAAH